MKWKNQAVLSLGLLFVWVALSIGNSYTLQHTPAIGWITGPTTDVEVELVDGKLIITYHVTHHNNVIAIPAIHPAPIMKPSDFESHEYYKEIYGVQDGKIVLEKTLIRETTYKQVTKEVMETVEEHEWVEELKD